NLSFKTVSKLFNNKIKTAIITDHPVVPIQYLPVCAALAVKEGLSYINALKAITIIPAEICKLDDKIGSLEIGKIADIVVFDKEPLDILANVDFVICSGNILKK
ncbi:MAG: amidohydrolase family protein, partial [Clostridia bacterium]